MRPPIQIILPDAWAVAVAHAVLIIQERKGWVRGRKKLESKVCVVLNVGLGWLAALSFEVGRGATVSNAVDDLG
jgi:hypothetical protein